VQVYATLSLGTSAVRMQTYQPESIIKIDFWGSLSMKNFVLGPAGNRCLESLLQCQWSPHTTAWRTICNTCHIHIYWGVANLPHIWAHCVENCLFYYNICPTWTLSWLSTWEPCVEQSVCWLQLSSFICNTNQYYYPLIVGQKITMEMLFQNQCWW